MPCNWSTTASFLLRSHQARTSTPSRARSCFTISQLTPRAGRCTIPPRGLLPRLRGFRCLATTAAPTTPSGEDAPSREFDAVESSIRSTSAGLSAAQISRAAAQAVRLSIQEGNYGDALYVVNSACHSVLQGPLDSGIQQTSHLQPIQFGCAVSPRLSAHVFLHGLIRAGYTKKADTFARLMMRTGIPIRSRTLESVVSSLVTPPSRLPKFGPFARVIPRKPVNNSSVMQLRSTRVGDKCARAALTLLQEARIFGQKRTERMYRVLIGTLLMQGEIIVASLLFVLLLKDYEVHHREVTDSVDPGGPDYITHDTLSISPPSRAALLDLPYPHPQLICKIMRTVDANSGSGMDPLGSQSVQSLAIFAMLLDTGQIRTSRLASLVSSLYRWPRSNASVWILRDGKPERVQAYEYFHSVLKRLIDSMAMEDPLRAVPRMSRKTYNSLLSYALRHRLSPEMASVVLHHMCGVREPPLTPDVTTYNILLRSGTLLRKTSISEAALSVLRRMTKAGPLQRMFRTFEEVTSSSPDAVEGPEPGDNAQLVADEAGQSETSGPPTVSDAEGFEGALQRLDTEILSLPESVRNPTRRMTADHYTFSSLVVHLTSTGQPQAVAEMLFRVLPELALINHPAKGTAIEERTPLVDRMKALQRAVERGPYAYASIINALTKAGEIGLAESVLILAQRGERASRIGLVPHVHPWRLTVHAYTAMMQGYAAVVHGQIPRHKLLPGYVGTRLLEPRESRPRPELSQQNQHGYAMFVHMLGEQDRRSHALTKPQRSRRNAALLYRSMTSGGRALLGDLIPNEEVKVGRSTLPVRPLEKYRVRLDARFFNAALKLFAPRAERIPRRRRTRELWQRRLELARTKGRLETVLGTAPKVSPMLPKLARAMVASGFQVPVGYRRLLEERWGWTSFEPKRARRVPNRRPYAFPEPPQTFQPYRLATFKTRGLPIRQRGRRTRIAMHGPIRVDVVT